MGNGYMIECKKCGHTFVATLGIGMLFLEVYKNVVSAIKNGEYGEDYKRFFEEHKNAVVDCDEVAAVCTQCGKLDTVLNMDLYLPKKDDIDEQYDYVMPDELKSDFVKCMEYKHKCSDCGGDMRVFDLHQELIDGNVKCPSCGETLEMDLESMMFWD